MALLPDLPKFQSTRPRGRTRLQSIIPIKRGSLFQSTRPRGRTRPVLPEAVSVYGVSIHASSREDATFRRVYGIIRCAGFNPRVLAGGRDSGAVFVVTGEFVSIHASSREDATLIVSNVTHDGDSFNPRVLAGGRDVFSRTAMKVKSKFQSTRPRGRTRLIGNAHNITYGKVSIHASSREDATLEPRNRFFLFVFQSTRPRGRTRHYIHIRGVAVAVSIHASSREDATQKHHQTR